jgi:hypothetical protein
LNNSIFGLNRFKYIVFLLLIFAGCGSFGQTDQIIGDYVIYSQDSLSDSQIMRKNKNGTLTSVIEPYVFAIGWDNNYIIAKRNIRTLGQKKVEWYIINVSTDNLFGPFSEEVFKEKKRQLGIPDNLGFRINTEFYGEGIK